MDSTVRVEKPIKHLTNTKKKISSKRLKKYSPFYVMLILPILYFIIFKYLPMYGVVIAFKQITAGESFFGGTWVGFKYFELFINDPVFWRDLRNTFLLSIYSLIIGFPIPIIFALLLNEIRNSGYKRFVQTVSYLPHFLSMVVVVGMLNQVLSPSGGVVNQIIGHFGIKPINFLTVPEYFRTIYISSGIWQSCGWSAILYIAALANVDPQLYEAAMIDGANRWKQTWYITLPGIMPTIIVTLILSIGGIMSIGFEKILLLYNPLTYETADVLATYVYRIGLGLNNYSFATAVGLFESLVGCLLILSANTFSKRMSNTSLW